MTEWTLTPAALAAVSAAALVVIAVASSLGRNVYDELLRDVRERTRDNGWAPVAAFASFDSFDSFDSSDSSDDLAPDRPPDFAAEEREAGTSDQRVEAAVAKAWAEARTQTAVEIDRIQQDAHLQHEAALGDIRAAAEAELVRVKRETAFTLAAKLEEARVESDRQRAAAVLEATTAAKAAAEVEMVQVKQAAARTLAAKLKEARAESDRQSAAVFEATTAAKAVAEAELERVQQEVAAVVAARAAASGKAMDTPVMTPLAEPVHMPASAHGQQTLEEHLREARSKVARHDRRHLRTER